MTVTPAQIPLVVDAAVVADEDRNFFTEAGIDSKAVIRAALANLHANAVVQGGSTITEQYVKLAYGDTDRSFTNKLKEAILASQIDRVTTKDDILYHYLTLVYYGDGSYGIGAAAEDYFRVPVQQLTLSEGGHAGRADPRAHHAGPSGKPGRRGGGSGARPGQTAATALHHRRRVPRGHGAALGPGRPDGTQGGDV